MVLPLRAAPRVCPPDRIGVILAIDYGQKRLGLALSDENEITSRPFAIWKRTNRRRDLARLHELVRRQGVRRIVVGSPLHLDGTVSEMSEEAKSFALRVEKALGIPVEMMDERLSSWEAGQTHAARKSRTRDARSRSVQSSRGQVAHVDDVAAAIILRDYLASKNARSETRD